VKPRQVDLAVGVAARDDESGESLDVLRRERALLALRLCDGGDEFLRGVAVQVQFESKLRNQWITFKVRGLKPGAFKLWVD
jgi:hypothetical protein